MMKIIVLLVILVLIWSALRCKVTIKTRSFQEADLPTEAKASTFSKALAELVAVAGGIYISLLLLFSFLDTATPGKIFIGGIQMDILALISLLIAVLQPIVLNFYKKYVA